MKVGFTGSKKGIRMYQKHTFKEALKFLKDNGMTEFHHGDCIGADAAAHEIVRKLYPDVKIVIHPPDKPDKRANMDGDEVRPEKPYLTRNSDIAIECDVVVATPKEDDMVVRSGTWSTVRRALWAKTPCLIITQNGKKIDAQKRYGGIS